MNVTIKQLKAFIVLSQSQSYAEASERLNLTQPALSIAIKNLESSLGGALLTRSTRSMSMTPEGQAFLPVAKRLLNDFDDALNDISNTFLLNTGKLSIAAMPFISAAILPSIMKQFSQSYPQITLSLHDVVNEDVISSVRSGKTELGICFNPGHTEDLTFEQLFTEELIAIVPRNHALAEGQEVNWASLISYPFITLQAPASLREDIRTAMQKNDIPFSVKIETHQLVTVGEMVAAGLGVSAVPRSSEKQMTDLGVICKPLNKPVISRKVGIIYRHRYQLSVAATALKKFIQEYFTV